MSIVPGVEKEPKTEVEIKDDFVSGLGWVRATVNHQYADAQRRGNPVSLFVAEPSGGVNDPLRDSLRALDHASRVATSTDATVYGVARSSPTRFYLYAPPGRTLQCCCICGCCDCP